MRYLIGSLIIIMVITLTAFETDDAYEPVTITHQTVYSLEEIEQDTFSVEKLIDYISFLNLRYGDIILAQSMEETGHYTSNIFKENHNLFGMKLATQRPHTYIGKNRGHAMYNSWRESVLDYAFYQAAYLRHAKTEEQYLNYLERNYAEKPGYKTRIKKLMEENDRKAETK